MSALGDYNTALRELTAARDALAVKTGKDLWDLYELARVQTLEEFLENYGHLEQYELQRIEATLAELRRILGPVTDQAARTRTAAIQEGWQLGQQGTLNLLAADPALPLARLEGYIGFIDQGMVGALFGNVPQLAGKVEDAVLDKVRRELTLGAIRGESIPQISRRIAGTGLTQEGLKKPFPSIKKRADAIARTEVIKASDAGYEDLVTRAEQLLGEDVYDLWLTAGDDRVEQECRNIAAGADPQYTSIPGHPGIYARGAGPRPVISTHPNCRCRRVPVVLRWLAEGWMDLSKLQKAA